MQNFDIFCPLGPYLGETKTGEILQEFFIVQLWKVNSNPDSRHIDNGDVYVKFIHPKGMSILFKWPLKEDECWVALNNVIKALKPPKSNQSGLLNSIHHWILRLFDVKNHGIISAHIFRFM